HNPEFTMVEWYEAYADYEDEARRLEEVVRAAAGAVDYAGPLDFQSPWRRVGFFEAIGQATGIEPGVLRDPRALPAAIAQRGLQLQAEGQAWPAIVDALFSRYAEPTLREPTFVLDYPVE